MSEGGSFGGTTENEVQHSNRPGETSKVSPCYKVFKIFSYTLYMTI